MKQINGLHVILGGMEFERMLELAQIAEDEGAAVVQLREKSRPATEVLKIADEFRKIIGRATFIINDRADIALAVGADGVHVGQADLPVAEARALLGNDAIIGVSTSNVEQALEAERAGANYLGFGHLFPTQSKEKNTAPRTLEELRAVIAAVSIPVIAIGGITLSNVNDILVLGIGGIAVISAVSGAENSRSVVRQLVKETLIKSFSITSLRGNPGGVTKQSLQIKLNLNRLLRRPSGTPRNDMERKT
jgi:thiamine-phosphate pyrophosphorylase